MGIQNLAGHVFGQYELRDLLGVGGMGAVYRGYQFNLERLVAIKVLSPTLATEPGYIERFYHEAKIAAALEHRHIIPVYDYGAQGDISYVVMRLLTGGTLAERIASRAKTTRPLPSLSETAELLTQVASALDYAHSQGVIHRDIKPSNMMFDHQGSAYLVDFGIAKLIRSKSSLTTSGSFMGTPSYMPPEQWRSEELADAADQYSLAVTIYSLLTGKLPFEATPPNALMTKHLNDIAPLAHTIRPHIPESASRVVEMALAKYPEERFPTVTAFAQAFAQAVRSRDESSTDYFTFSPSAKIPASKPRQQSFALPDEFQVHTVDTGALDASSLQDMFSSRPVPKSPAPDPEPPQPAAPDTTAQVNDTALDEVLEAELAPEDGEETPEFVEEDFVAVTVSPEPSGKLTVAPRTVSPVLPSRRSIQRPKRPRNRVWLTTISSLFVINAAALLVSTIFSLWTPLSDEFQAQLNQVKATQHLGYTVPPTPLPTLQREVRIGIIAGHSGSPLNPEFDVDPGSVCDDGLTELSINTAVAQKVVQKLRAADYTVEMLEEFDPKLENYEANVLISIHSNDCQDYGPEATGYNVASASARNTTAGADDRLRDCIVQYYGMITALPRHLGLTADMTEYHSFDEVSPDTPMAIIELGFMRNDRDKLTQQQDLLADGLTNGILCFLQPERYGTPESSAQ